METNFKTFVNGLDKNEPFSIYVSLLTKSNASKMKIQLTPYLTIPYLRGECRLGRHPALRPQYNLLILIKFLSSHVS